MTYTVYISAEAQADIVNTVQYLQSNSRSAATRWHVRCLERIVALGIEPRTWPPAEEQHRVNYELRQCLFWMKSKHANRILFTIQDNAVVVLAIRRPGQPLVEPDELKF